MRTRMLSLVIGLPLSLVFVAAGGIGLAATPSRDAPDPTRAGAAPAVPGDGRNLDGLIVSLQGTLRRVPSDYSSWATLGIAYVEKARNTGDATLYAKADGAVKRSFAVEPDGNFAALAASAAVDAARHKFSGALGEADRALAIDGYDIGALSLRIDALTELGRYPEQLQALRVADRRRPGVPIAARYAYAYELRGRLGRAATILINAADSATPSDRAFLLTLLANVERRQGRFAVAGKHLRDAQRASPGYLAAIVSRARLDVALGRPRQALDDWRTVVARYPVPEYLTELGELEEHLGNRSAAQDQYDVIRATITLLRASGVNADLETALYQADHGDPGQGLTAARTEWSRRKSIHVADALGWSLHRTGNDRAALRFARRATALGTAEAILWIHRGSIEASLGLDRAAGAHLRRGLEQDRGLSPWQADRARAVLASLRAVQ